MTKRKTSITLNGKTLEALDEMADADDRSRSGMIRQLIREGKERRETAEAAKITKETKETQNDPKD